MRILVVDDERGIADSVRAILMMHGYESVAMYSATEALECIPGFQPHLIISDVVMPKMNGIELLSRVRNLYPATLIILISGNTATEQLVAEAGDLLKSTKILAKPFSPRELLRLIGEFKSSGDNA
jgi:DNA-binding response OmpR family regulator